MVMNQHLRIYLEILTIPVHHPCRMWFEIEDFIRLEHYEPKHDTNIEFNILQHTNSYVFLACWERITGDLNYIIGIRFPFLPVVRTERNIVSCLVFGEIVEQIGDWGVVLQR
jgi:hypothetical protein